MNKILTKVTALCVGLAMVAGVGVAVGSKKVSAAHADSVTLTQADFSSSWTTTQGPQSGTAKGFTLATTSGLYNSAHLRQYAGATLTLSSNVGKMTQVVFTCTANGTANYGPGKMSGNGYVASSGKTGTWTGNADSFSLTGGQSRITSIAITYTVSAEPGLFLGSNSMWLVDEGSAKSVTYTTSNFSSTPSVAVSGTPNYVDVSVSAGSISISPKSIGTETLTFVATQGTQQASASLNVKVYGKHGLVEDDPFTVAEAREAIDNGGPLESVYVRGIISQIDTPSSFSGQICYYISDDGSTTNQFEIYWGRNIGNVNFDSVDDIALEATVVNHGNIKKYNSTYEFDSGSYLISYTPKSASPLSSISLSGTHATSFDVGDTFSYAGLVVTAHYEDSSSKTVTPTSVSTPDMSSAGQKTVIVSYTENEVSKSAEYTITVNSVTYYEISFLPGEGSGTHASAQAKEGSDYELPTTTTFTAPEGKVFDYWDLGGEKVTVIENVDDDYEVTAIWKDAPSEVSDTLTSELIGVTSYGNWSDISATSSAVYAGNSTKSSNNAIQMRSNNSNSGIVTTTSGGTITKVIVVWNTTDAPTTARTLDIYAKASGYSAASDLYNSSTQGTKVGSLSYTNTTTNETTLEITDEYTYVGVRSNSGAIYIDSITFVWSGSTPTPKVLTEISVENPQTEYEVGDAFVYPKVVAHYDDESSKYVTSATFTNDSTAVAGNFVVGVSYSENAITRETSYNITVSEPAPVETKTYKKVKTTLANFAGDYLIVYEEGSVAFDGSLENPDVASNTFSVSITDEAISASEAYEFTVAKKEGGYSLKSASGLYIGKTADSNGMDKNASDNYTNTISYSGTEESDMDIVGSGKPHLRYNASSGQERFRFFKSESYTGQKAVSLYIEVANDAEAFALDILNLTTEVCSAEGEHASGDFATAWSTLTTKYNSVANKDLLVEGEADANGTFFAEALARYDILVAKYGLTAFMQGRVSNLAYLPNYQSNLDSSSSITIIVIVAVTSMTLLGVTLVLRKRKHQ